ncbi:MAG: helix-turn-helix transcriptional regulator [Cyclobacteriaceae bacterium]|jgi:transcriptional regulator with XRE-family HTH domain|tara:strand:+ start:1276 stop:1602 length:327 start_codon:yes stop_codon:yes gene_type:complete
MSALNISLLSDMVKTRRGAKGLRDTAKEIGEISASTLSRIEQGKVPDVDTFMKLCDWLQVSADTFFNNTSQKAVQVNAHLRAEKELPPNTVNALIKLINLAEIKSNTG